ncbi:putative disease resistance protein RGA3 [Cryptomeria japonica]|uniref:putative disease resistance protein RGA3 n=1 Tax=Cryptomeria japonica TaxID=3369 RepID=UPI0027DA4062|nr:putative disease resistance protein RGA3 [Cryptomeria japonica]
MEFVLAKAAVGKVCEMAIQQVANEVSIVFNFREEFQWLPNRFIEINCALNEANEESTGQKESVKNWLLRVRDIAWEAEDILQECAVDSLYATNTQFSALLPRLKMGRRIQKLKARLSSVVQDGNQLNIVRAAMAHKEEEAAESSIRSQGQRFRRSSLLPKDSKPVGIESKMESMVNLLVNPHIPIIAVVGMGGIGKTYLLQKLYDAIKGRYEISAWISVSQFYSVSQLQRDLAFQLDEELSKRIDVGGVSEGPVAQSIHGFLLGKRYLIVLDDVWRATREGDLLTKLGIPTRDIRESKILLSTRSREVCENLNARVYQMECLTDEESWSLFCAYAFPGSKGNRAPQHLEKVTHNIVKECGNLPLAIKTTAASLSSTTQPRDWQSKFSKLKKVGTSKDLLMDILKLSYYSLPAHLKACFAYLSFFPEDEIIEENKCAFSVEEAFDKLQSVNTDGSRWCRLFLAKKDIDKHAISERRPVSPTLVRTVSLSHNYKIEGNIPAMLFSGMRVLRVMDLSYTNISTLPACVEEMKLLKVLNLRRTKIRKLPKCLRCLKSLSFLDVSDCRLKKNQAPKWISELKCLQHLEGPFVRMPKGISKLEPLRTLRVDEFLSLSMEEDGALRLDDVGKMREIEEIAFTVEHESQLKRMEEGVLSPLLNMRRLEVNNAIVGMRCESESESDLPQFSERMSTMRDLEYLKLYYFAVPSWICHLYLSNGHCSNYPELQAMPNLVSLDLHYNKRCREVPKAFGKSGGFPHLRFLFIDEFPKLEEFLEMEDGAMTCLEKLRLRNCEKVNKMGEGLDSRRSILEVSQGDINLGRS